jgi:hypothetical protein
MTFIFGLFRATAIRHAVIRWLPLNTALRTGAGVFIAHPYRALDQMR